MLKQLTFFVTWGLWLGLLQGGCERRPEKPPTLSQASFGTEKDHCSQGGAGQSEAQCEVSPALDRGLASLSQASLTPEQKSAQRNDALNHQKRQVLFQAALEAEKKSVSQGPVKSLASSPPFVPKSSFEFDVPKTVPQAECEELEEEKPVVPEVQKKSLLGQNIGLSTRKVPSPQRLPREPNKTPCERIEVYFKVSPERSQRGAVHWERLQEILQWRKDQACGAWSLIEQRGLASELAWLMEHQEEKYSKVFKKFGKDFSFLNRHQDFHIFEKSCDSLKAYFEGSQGRVGRGEEMNAKVLLQQLEKIKESPFCQEDEGFQEVFQKNLPLELGFFLTQGKTKAFFELLEKAQSFLPQLHTPQAATFWKERLKEAIEAEGDSSLKALWQVRSRWPGLLQAWIELDSGLFTKNGEERHLEFFLKTRPQGTRSLASEEEARRKFLQARLTIPRYSSEWNQEGWEAFERQWKKQTGPFTLPLTLDQQQSFLQALFGVRQKDSSVSLMPLLAFLNEQFPQSPPIHALSPVLCGSWCRPEDFTCAKACSHFLTQDLLPSWVQAREKTWAGRFFLLAHRASLPQCFQKVSGEMKACDALNQEQSLGPKEKMLVLLVLRKRLDDVQKVLADQYRYGTSALKRRPWLQKEKVLLAELHEWQKNFSLSNTGVRRLLCDQKEDHKGSEGQCFKIFLEQLSFPSEGFARQASPGPVEELIKDLTELKETRSDSDPSLSQGGVLKLQQKSLQERIDALSQPPQAWKP